MTIPWTGRMRTSYLADGTIQPTEFKNWTRALEWFERVPREREILMDIMASLPEVGLKEPLKIGIDRYGPELYVDDGHHRAVALITLKVIWFPFHWHWYAPGPVRLESKPFPFGQLGMEGS